MSSLRRRLFSLILLAVLPLIVANLISISILGNRLWRTTLRDVEQVTNVLHDVVETTLRESIVSYLRAKVETAGALIRSLNSAGRNELSEEERVAITRSLETIAVADTGYIYVINTDGEVVIHPDAEIQGMRLPDQEPVKTQLATRQGYLEYMWQNSFEPAPLPKALFMEPYEPLDWIVAATSYRQEFVSLVDRERIADLLGSVSFDIESYSTVVARDGTLVAHPDYAGRSMTEFFPGSEGEQIVNEMFSEREGQVRYAWPGREGERRRPKVMFYRYLPDFDWVVGTTVYLDSLRAPALQLVAVLGVLSIGLLLALLLLTTRMSRAVTNPVVRLAEAADRAERLDEMPVQRRTPSEIVGLMRRFNGFVDRIQQQRREVADREARLRKTVTEKTELLREIHHRVKNNLQVIASLLNLQAESVHDARDATLFARSAERVISMALVHEQLHQAENTALIPFREYLGELVGHLSDASVDRNVRVNVESDDITLEIYRAVPCGLIVNELVTNAIEHAFPRNTDGTITVSFRDHGETYRLEVADTGEGMSEEAERALGLTLVESLTQQVHATLSVSTDPGTRFILDLPAVSPLERGSG